jgi:phosphoglycolate phosphatase-like HAD superfamily hydrolase
LEKEQYKKCETILIGDSVNDYEAADINGIEFYGYNNLSLKKINNKYLYDFNNFKESI